MRMVKHSHSFLTPFSLCQVSEALLDMARAMAAMHSGMAGLREEVAALKDRGPMAGLGKATDAESAPGVPEVEADGGSRSRSPVLGSGGVPDGESGRPVSRSSGSDGGFSHLGVREAGALALSAAAVGAGLAVLVMTILNR